MMDELMLQGGRTRYRSRPQSIPLLLCQSDRRRVYKRLTTYPGLRLPVDEEAAVVDLDGAVRLEVAVLGPPVDEGALLQLPRHLDVPV